MNTTVPENPKNRQMSKLEPDVPDMEISLSPSPKRPTHGYIRGFPPREFKPLNYINNGIVKLYPGFRKKLRNAFKASTKCMN